MILAVNIGNTNIRAVTGEKKPESEIIIPLCRISDGGGFTEFIGQGFGENIWENLEGSIVASVVPSLTEVIVKSIAVKTGKTPKRINLQDCGKINLSQYGGLPGEDRAACCAGALSKYTPPFIVIDFGTATTVNVVSLNGEFLGGAIFTGVQTGLKALAGNTAQLPEINARSPDIRIIGKSTEENLLSGAVIGAACIAEGYIRKIEREYGEVYTVVVTGGHAPEVLPYCEFESIHEPHLLFHGLFAVYYN